MPKNFTAIAQEMKRVEKLGDEWAAGRVAEAVLDSAIEKLQRLCGAPIGSSKVVASHDRPWPAHTKQQPYVRQLEQRQKAAPLRVTPQGVRTAQGSVKATQRPQTAQEQRATRQAYQQRAQSAQARLQAHEVAELRRAAQERAQAAQERAARIAALKERLRDEQAQKNLLTLFAYQTRRLN